MKKRLPVVEVIWRDCQLFTGGWESHASIMRTVERTTQRSVGYVLRDNKAGIVLTESLSQGGNVYGTVSIPAAQIVKRKRLR